MKDAGEWADVGDRVRECRIAADMSQEQLASALRLDRTMIVKIESGVRRVDALELAKLSAVLNVPLAYFLSPPAKVMSRRSEVADDTATDATRQSFRLEVALSTWLSDVRQLMELGELSCRPPVRYPDPVEDAETARVAARWVRKARRLRLGPISSLMSLCERLGQLVAVVETPGEGASMIDDGLAVAVVSYHSDPGRRRATAAHELGHMVIGDEYSADLGLHASRSEREAVIDAFAAELLLPTDAVTQRFAAGNASERENLVVLAAEYRTSWSLAVRQAMVAGVIGKESATSMRKRNPTYAELMEAVGWAPQPDLESVRVPPSFAHAVMNSLSGRRITTARAVELMRKQIKESDLPPRDDPGDEL
ncbi:XRE family transcriptional regulator [Spongiactinospora sp. TRM90649]|uniref:helix-turn-helix domain-containing protein n=1 Tax=Spongiactinospora sp. TRM90649 TaxID=3031114 RepID=UPI0023FA3652|nr:XRE family transcriptional regulator [Spongiactinospora sp. TRM90649]MDF5754456.1 XRE family transcriptional regulator [Spongiactinospora sp. TRM90649]